MVDSKRAPTDPQLVARVFSLCADLLRGHADTKADDLAELQRLNADLLTALADATRAAADELLTVGEAASIAKVSSVTVRQWVAKYDNFGAFDRRSKIYLISRTRLEQLLAARGFAGATNPPLRETSAKKENTA